MWGGGKIRARYGQDMGKIRVRGCRGANHRINQLKGGQGAESEARKEPISINNKVNNISDKFMNFIIGMTKYFHNSGFFKILYGYSALFLCIYKYFRRCCTHFCFCCKCCMGMQHVQHVACNIFSHIFHCCILVQHQLYT